MVVSGLYPLLALSSDLDVFVYAIRVEKCLPRLTAIYSMDRLLVIECMFVLKQAKRRKIIATRLPLLVL